MKNYNNESKTYGFLIYVGIGIIILNVYVFAVENTSASTNDNLTIAILQLFVGLMVITSAITSGIIAYKF